MKDYYALLHLKPNASPAQVDAAYRRLMQRHHPNVRANAQALDRMRDLNEAWRVLGDPAQRALYDRARRQDESYQPPAPPPTLRSVPPSAFAEFGARRAPGGTCLVALGVTLVLVFALGILAWGLNEQYSLFATLAEWQAQIGIVFSINPNDGTNLALADVTPTPDPRCRSGCVTPPPGCVVKGDIEGNGTRYFYLPNDEGYGNVQVNTARGDRWFCALNDAQSAGWTRKAPTPTPTLPPPPDALISPVARRTLIVCGENAALRQGPGEEFALVRQVANGTRLVVTGVNGDWSVVNGGRGSAFIRASVLCTPTRAAAQPTAPATSTPEPASPTSETTVAVNPAASAFKYPAVALVSPSNGQKYWCSRDLVLQWAFNALLAPDEFFLVESKAHEHERWTALYDWTKETTVMLHPNRGGGICDTVWWSNTGIYEWRVSVVRGSKVTPTYLSPFSEISIINYAQ